ncbi:hypothetical protein ACXWR7_10985, partial [Streptococcus pyogenes]
NAIKSRVPPFLFLSPFPFPFFSSSPFLPSLSSFFLLFPPSPPFPLFLSFSPSPLPSFSPFLSSPLFLSFFLLSSPFPSSPSPSFLPF